MKRILPYLWNALAVLVIALAAMETVPRARQQVTAPHATPYEIAIGYTEIGLFIGVSLCAVSVTPVFWFRVPVWFRVTIALVLGALAFGSIRVSTWIATSPSTFSRAVSEVELVIFFGTLAVFTLPLLVTGCGYPGLIQRLSKRKPDT